MRTYRLPESAQSCLAASFVEFLREEVYATLEFQWTTYSAFFTGPNWPEDALAAIHNTTLSRILIYLDAMCSLTCNIDASLYTDLKALHALLHEVFFHTNL